MSTPSADETIDAPDVLPSAPPPDLRTTQPGTSNADSMPGRVGRYVVIERIGAGAMGVVYAAYDPKLDRKIAVKVLLPGRGGDEAQARLLREAQAMARLSHPNVVAVHDVGEHERSVYVAMDFVRGQTLRAWLESERRPWRQVLASFEQAARGLAAAHEAGIVHRDFKPDNVLIDGSGRVMVTDFGVARTSGGGDPTIPESITTSKPDAKVVMTRRGALVGTPAYMAPEQFEGAEIDARTDQFALCVALWEGLYGERPFAGKSVLELAFSIARGRRRAPTSRAPVPRWLRRVLERGLSVEPSARWPSVPAMLVALAHGRRRASLGMGVMAVGVVALVGLGVEVRRRSEIANNVERCEQAALEIAGTWPGAEDSTRFAVRDALLATGTTYASITVAKVEPLLGDYARQWQAARRTTCLRHEVERVWNDAVGAAARECLDDRGQELAALVDELRRADATVVQKAVPAAAALAPIEPCTDESSLARRPVSPPDARDEVGRIRNELVRASAMRRAGHPGDAVPICESALAAADALGWAPLRASARMALGHALVDTGSYARAEGELVEAYVEGSKSEAHEIAHEAASKLIRLVGDHAARPDDGLLWGRLAEIELERLGAEQDDLVVAPSLNNLANVYRVQGAYARSLELHTRALAIFEAALGPDHPDVATTLNALANAHALMGSHEQALALHERARTVYEAALGPEHPTVAASLGNLANVHRARGDYAEALAAHERALAIRERALGPDHPDVAASFDNIGGIHYALGAYRDALSFHERALAIREEHLGREHPSVASCLSNLANVHRATGDYARARSLHERALAIREEAFGADHSDVAQSLNNLANVYYAQGEPEQALALHERALAIWEKTFGPGHPEVATSLENLATMHHALQAPANAKALLERALAIREAALGRDHPAVASALYNLATVHGDMGDEAQAHALHVRALAIREAALGPEHPDTAHSLVAVAALVIRQRDPGSAAALLQRALAIREASPATPLELLVDTRRELAKALASHR